MRGKIALAGSIVSFVGVFWLIGIIASLLGLPVFIDYGASQTITRGSGRYSYDEEVDGAMTDVGLFQVVIAGMIAWRIYHLILTGSFVHDLSVKSRRSWWAFFIAALAYITVVTPISLIEMPGFVTRCISLGVLAALFFFFKSPRGERLMEHLVKI
ncbi:hypothetical protein KVQ82_16515 [Pseudomonas sp. AO-1]|uniref:hypothetical protein n=1 Tax=Pseudomonas sp. AO-1 TaxID=2855434 RepID=UPI001C796617|nr:hypothetical protein [Pseudomonas sp. AO-1]QXZ11695.1 hypothetical protein KVQ82_16515 [Pseudomonas sp. AO-1]